MLWAIWRFPKRTWKHIIMIVFQSIIAKHFFPLFSYPEGLDRWKAQIRSWYFVKFFCLWCHILVKVFCSLWCWLVSFSNFRLNRKYFVSTVDFPPPLKPLITYATLTVFKKFLMRGLCVIFYGPTLMIVAVGVSHPGVLDILLAKYLLVSRFLSVYFSSLKKKRQRFMS